MILVIGTINVGINNYFFYKNEEKQTLRNMRHEAIQLDAILSSCEGSQKECNQITQSFLDNSSIRGEIYLFENGSEIYSSNLEGLKDQRTVVSFNKDFLVNNTKYTIQYKKLVTPPLGTSIFRSMTLSLFELNEAGLKNDPSSSYWDNVGTFFFEIALPRSRPAIGYFIFTILIFALIYFYLLFLKRNWEDSERIILAKDDKIFNLTSQLDSSENEKIQISQQLALIENNFKNLDHDNNLLLNRKSKLETLVGTLYKDIEAEKERINLLVAQKESEFLKKMETAKQNHSNEKNDLIKVQTQLEDAYETELKSLTRISNEKITNFEEEVVNLNVTLSDLTDKQLYLELELIEAKERLNSASNNLESKNIEVSELQNHINQITQERNSERKTQNSFVSKDIKKWIYKYLFTNPSLSSPVASQKIKFVTRDHHGEKFVEKVYDLLSNELELVKFILSIQSCENVRRTPNSIIVSYANQHGLNNQNSKFIARIVGDSDEGYAAEVLLNARSEWEAIVQAKMMIIKIKQFQDYTIIDKLPSSLNRKKNIDAA